MRAVTGRIVKGAVTTRARLPEGARVRILIEDDRPAVELDEDEVAGMQRGLAEHASGQSMPASRLRAKLRRPR